MIGLTCDSHHAASNPATSVIGMKGVVIGRPHTDPELEQPDQQEDENDQGDGPAAEVDPTAISHG